MNDSLLVLVTGRPLSSPSVSDLTCRYSDAAAAAAGRGDAIRFQLNDCRVQTTVCG